MLTSFKELLRLNVDHAVRHFDISFTQIYKKKLYIKKTFY